MDTSAVNHTWTHHAEASRSVHLLKIHSFSCTNQYSVYCINPSRNVGGYEWEIQFYPYYYSVNWHRYYMALVLIFRGEAQAKSVKASLSCRLVDPSGALQPSAEKVSASTPFQCPSDSSQPFLFMSRDDVHASGFLKNGSLCVECAITVFKDLNAIDVPCSNLRQHLGELLASVARSDITFIVSGKSFAAHKNVLAARSPVFKAEFFGEMKEKSSRRVEIQEMESSVFGAMLRFIYTDSEVPELDDEKPEAAMLAQHLLSAADRYGLDRLKVMCERRLAYTIESSTAATTLALAERHGCLQLKAKCIEFIAGGSRENLEASTPSMVTELLRGTHGRKN